MIRNNQVNFITVFLWAVAPTSDSHIIAVTKGVPKWNIEMHITHQRQDRDGSDNTSLPIHYAIWPVQGTVTVLYRACVCYQSHPQRKLKPIMCDNTCASLSKEGTVFVCYS